ncbi:gluconate kinase [Actinobacillus equuli]|nr:gluconate kinase [Actinobacillus equuli]
MFCVEKKYRDQIRQGNQKVTFIHLHGSFELILERMKKRKGHFMKTEMLKSQFDTLEIPQADESDVISIDINGSFENVVQLCVQAIQAQ